jgi:hypothetical protein
MVHVHKSEEAFKGIHPSEEHWVEFTKALTFTDPNLLKMRKTV